MTHAPADENRAGGNGLLSAAAIIAIAGLASRFLGLLRDRLLADRFGAGAILDAYFAAYRIPDLLYNLLILGALSAAFLPVVSRYLARGEPGRANAFHMANALVTIAVGLLTCLSVALAFLAPHLVSVLAPGFDESRRALTIQLTRILLLQPILLGVSSIVSGLLLSFHRFFAYAAAPVFYNAGIILGVMLFVPSLGPIGLAWGVATGALLHVLVQIPSLLRTGFRFRPTLTLHHEGLTAVSRLFIPRLISLAAGQVGALVVTVLGSQLVPGSIAAFAFAENLQSVPIGIVGISMAVAVFPFLASAAARQDTVEFSAVLSRAIRLTVFVALPASVLLLLFRAQIVRVILGTGAFSWQDTRETLTILGILALSVVPQSVLPILARAFFSVHDTRTPMLVSIAAIIINIFSAIILVPYVGVSGIAWSITLSSFLNFLLLLTFLYERLGGLDDWRLLSSIARVAIATFVAALIIQGPALVLDRMGIDLSGAPRALALTATGLKGLIAAHVNMQTFSGVATQLFGALGGGVLVFLAMARLLRIPEISLVHALFRRPRSLLAAVTDERTE